MKKDLKKAARGNPLFLSALEKLRIFPTRVFKIIKKRGVKTSRSSVFNVIGVLVKAGILRQVNLPSVSGTLYELALRHKHHHHFICEKCQKSIEFCYPEIESIKEFLEEALGIEIKFSALYIYGICKECKSIS